MQKNERLKGETVKQSDAQAKYKEFRDKIAATEKPGLIGMAAGLERLTLQNDLNHFRSQCQDWGITLLEPCPFCGSYDVEINEGAHLGDSCWVNCDQCETEGPPSKKLDSAIAAWNTRHS